MNAGSFAPALALNADFRPLNYFPLSLWSWQDAVKAVCLDRVTIISEYDQTISSPSIEIRLPSVIALKEYVPQKRNPAFTRFNVFLRDRFFVPDQLLGLDRDSVIHAAGLAVAPEGILDHGVDAGEKRLPMFDKADEGTVDHKRHALANRVGGLRGDRAESFLRFGASRIVNVRIRFLQADPRAPKVLKLGRGQIGLTRGINSVRGEVLRRRFLKSVPDRVVKSFDRFNKSSLPGRKILADSYGATHDTVVAVPGGG